MKNSAIRHLLSVMCLALLSVPGNAQTARTWVSGVGSDSGTCSRSAPCMTFTYALSQTSAGGEINCLDPGGFGAVTITMALTINCEGTLGSVLVSGTNGIVVQAGTSDTVTLVGLEFEGLGTGLNAVRFLSGKELHMHKFQIRHFTNSGIDIEPSNSTRVLLADGSNYASGTGVTALRPQPAGSSTAGAARAAAMARTPPATSQ